MSVPEAEESKPRVRSFVVKSFHKRPVGEIDKSIVETFPFGSVAESFV
jgi:hypothetical protein